MRIRERGRKRETLRSTVEDLPASNVSVGRALNRNAWCLFGSMLPPSTAFGENHERPVRGTLPFTFGIDASGGILDRYDNHIQRHLSAMAGQYQDQEAYAALLAQGDVFSTRCTKRYVRKLQGELLNGLSVLHAGKVGDEYFMTKGHFHAVLETAEVYYLPERRGYDGDGDAGRGLGRGRDAARTCALCSAALGPSFGQYELPVRTWYSSSSIPATRVTTMAPLSDGFPQAGRWNEMASPRSSTTRVGRPRKD